MFKKLILILSFFILSCSNLNLDNVKCNTGDDCPEDAICVHSKCILKSDNPSCYNDTNCKSNEVCRNNTCSPSNTSPCFENTERCNPIQNAIETCIKGKWEIKQNCEEHETCEREGEVFFCKNSFCEHEDERICLNDNEFKVCSGGKWNKLKCANDEICQDGRCKKICSLNSPNGYCDNNQECINGECQSPCSYQYPNGYCPENQICQSGECVQMCSPDNHTNKGWCEDGKICRNGACIFPCSELNTGGYCDPGYQCEYNGICIPDTPINCGKGGYYEAGEGICKCFTGFHNENRTDKTTPCIINGPSACKEENHNKTRCNDNSVEVCQQRESGSSTGINWGEWKTLDSCLEHQVCVNDGFRAVCLNKCNNDFDCQENEICRFNYQGSYCEPLPECTEEFTNNCKQRDINAKCIMTQTGNLQNELLPECFCSENYMESMPDEDGPMTCIEKAGLCKDAYCGEGATCRNEDNTYRCICDTNSGYIKVATSKESQCAKQCQSDSECPAGMVCYYKEPKYCTKPCSDPQDCNQGEICDENYCIKN